MSEESQSKGSRWRSWAQQDRIIPRTQQRSLSSRWLYRIDHYSSLPWAALAVVMVLVGSILVGVVLRFSPGWTTGFETGTSSVTLVMLFVIQHTQSREQAATQRKLDELLRATPEAESGLMLLEEASDDVMRDVESELRGSKESGASPPEEGEGRGPSTRPPDGGRLPAVRR
jgi:low affinity Fe/Cu permease